MSDKNINYLKNELSYDWTETDENFRKVLAERIIFLSEHIWSQLNVNQIDEQNNIYWGKVGIAYMFWLLSIQSSFITEEKAVEYRSRATKLITSSLQSQNTEKEHSFMFGKCGLFYLAGLIFNATKEDNNRDNYLNLFIRFATFHLTADYENKQRDTIAEGRAGYIMAALLANNSFNSHIIAVECIQNMGISVIKSGKFDALINKSDLPIIFENTNGLTLDISEGMSGPLLALLCIPDLFKLHPQFEADIKKVVDSIVSKQSSDGSYFSDPKKPDPDNWYYGSAGVSFLIAKAYYIWSEDKYKKSLENCGEYLWKRCLTESGPGISTGISGFGYAFLMIYRSIGDKIYLNRAKHLAKYMSQNSYIDRNHKLEHPLSLFEGWPGLVCYLIGVYDLTFASIPIFCNLFSKETVNLTEDLASLELEENVKEIQSNLKPKPLNQKLSDI